MKINQELLNYCYKVAIKYRGGLKGIDIDDCVQNSIIEMQYIPDGISNYYIDKIIYNEIYKQKIDRVNSIFEELPEFYEETLFCEDEQDKEEDVDYTIVKDAIKELSDLDRRVCIQRYYENKSIEEIAISEGINIKKVYNTLKQIKSKLRVKLDGKIRTLKIVEEK